MYFVFRSDHLIKPKLLRASFRILEMRIQMPLADADASTGHGQHLVHGHKFFRIEILRRVVIEVILICPFDAGIAVINDKRLVGEHVGWQYACVNRIAVITISGIRLDITLNVLP